MSGATLRIPDDLSLVPEHRWRRPLQGEGSFSRGAV
jgi:hypothetical protein